jgi:hypothetical protein
MKKIITILGIFFICFQLSSQNFTTKLGEVRPYSRFTVSVNGGAINDRFYMINKNLASYSLEVYDIGSMNLLSSRVFVGAGCKGSAGNCIEDGFDYTRSLFLKDGLILFFNTYNRSTEEHQLYVQRVNRDGNFEGKLLLVDKIKSEKRQNSGSFLIEVSQDSTMFLVVSNPPFEKNEKEKFNFKVFDSKFNNIKNVGVVLPYKDKNVGVSNYYLGNDGNIYLLANVELEKSQRERGQAPYFFSILSLPINSSDLEEIKVNLASKNIEDIAIQIDNKNKKLICTGFYSNLKPNQYEGKDIDGFFYLRLNPVNKEVEVTSYKEIDKKMVAQLINKKKVKEDKGFSSYFKIADLKTRSDGSSTLFAEFQHDYAVTSTTTSNGVTTTSTQYHYVRNNIFVININRDGSVGSLIDIPKVQHTINDNGLFSSFLLFEKGDRYFLVYNDNPENLTNGARTIDDIKPMKNFRKACLVASELNKDGSYTKQKIYDYNRDGLITSPAMAIKLKDGKYVAPATHLTVTCSCFAWFTKIKKGLLMINL